MKHKSSKHQFAFSYFSKVVLLLGLIFLTPLSSTFAQDNPQNVEVKMKDGSSIIGELIAETPEKIVIKNNTLGEVTILRSNIAEYRTLRSIITKDGVYWHENPNPTRNIYGPTGYGLRQGEGYYQNFMVFLNQVSYGFSDNFTIGVGVEIASILFGLNEGADSNFPGFTITPKFSFPIKEDQWNVGVGVLAVHIPSTEKLFSLGIVYGVSTWGTRENNVTLGLGFGVAEGEFTGKPIVTLAGNYRTGRRFGLVTENWFIPFDGEYGSLISFGGRYIGERITWDFALFGVSADGGFFISPVPLIGLSFPFGTGWKN